MTKDLKIYFLNRYTLHSVALVSKATVIGGAVLDEVYVNGVKWFSIKILWSNTKVGTATLIYSILGHYKYILSVDIMSNDAEALVKGFHKRNKGTESVVEGIRHTDNELGAGFVGSERLRKLPVTISILENDKEISKMMQIVDDGFRTAFGRSSL